jgi:putative thiamine transport system substrate-binding protein
MTRSPARSAIAAALLAALATVIAMLVGLLTRGLDAQAQATAQSWREIERVAHGQQVYFNAWAGDTAINRYIAWAGQEVERRYGVQLIHVKVADVSAAVARILAERAAGRTAKGSIDLIWINGENFASLKAAGLLHGPWAEEIPNARLLDRSDPTLTLDFTVPTEGYELPWGGARFSLFYDAAAIAGAPPADPQALLKWIRSHPGRFTYPQPPDFIGSSFLKQLLLLLTDSPERLRAPVGEDFDTVTRPLWRWLDEARPHLWRSGRVFPRGVSEQRRLLGDGEIDWTLSFNPAEAARAIGQGELPDSIRGIHFSGGALSNSHFLAIPFNAGAKEGAMVVANFLISPEAQARKANDAIWGDPAVLAIDRLSDAERRLFQSPERSAARPPADVRRLLEPHPSWTLALEHAWAQRYSAR